MHTQCEAKRLSRKTRSILAVGIIVCLALFAGRSRVVYGSDGADKNVSTLSSAQIAFEFLKKLEGKWVGRSTKGWEEKTSFKTIAGGSVVVEDTPDAKPDESMMTMYHLDGDRLMLTHYCEAKNQPRLVATSFADGAKTITFTFLDGGNIPTRDRGHMDKLVMRFLDDNHVTKQWTWYQDGAERWLEEIRLVRQP